jgi:hypothetical protein
MLPTMIGAVNFALYSKTSTRSTSTTIRTMPPPSTTCSKSWQLPTPYVLSVMHQNLPPSPPTLSPIQS